MNCYEQILVLLMWVSVETDRPTSAKRNSSYSTYSILFLTYTSYFGGKKGISRNKMKLFFLMLADLTGSMDQVDPECPICSR